MRTLLALTVCLCAALPVFAHEDDPKARDWEPPFIGPVWHFGDDGLAGSTFNSSGMTLMSWFPINNFDIAGQVNSSGNDCWGYRSSLGREYAIIGLSNGTGFVDVTNPAAATIVRFIPGPNSLWRNVKTYLTYCYAVSEGGGGIQVFDLAQIDAGQVTELPSVTTGGGLSTHTMIINTTTGYLYRMGGGSSGIRIYNLNPSPAVPAYVGAWSDRYIHDGVVYSYTSGPYAGKEIFFACGGSNGGQTNTGMDIIDVTNKAALVNMSRFTYSSAAYCHQVWLTEDRQYAYINDEIDEANFGLYSVGRIVSVGNLSAPTLAGTYNTGVNTVDHNLYVKGTTLFCSNYKSGIRIFDLANPTSPQQNAWFDTYPTDDSGGYAGLWSNYPYFPSGTIIGSDLQRGLFVWRMGEPGGSIAFAGGSPPAFVTPQGAVIGVTVTPAAGATTVAVVLTFDDGSASQDISMQQIGAEWRGTLPTLACGSSLSFAVTASFNTGIPVRSPAAGLYSAIAALGEVASFNDAMETNTGWQVGAPTDTAISGIWVRVDPNGTTAQPENDHSDPGTMAWVTGQGVAGGGAGSADVDGGATSLTSPLMNAAGLSDATLVYWRWYSNNLGGAPNTDSMPVLISGDGGKVWVQLEDVTINTGAWIEKRWLISDYVTPSDMVQVRFVARDTGTGSLVEAGVDDVRIIGYQCPAAVPGDLDGDGVVSGGDLAVLLGQWGSAGSGDFDQSGAVDGSDLAYLLAHWS
ncbi:MAG: choice-of-anchor B family protein [Phycisphaerales bacterium]|nr:choice-of-anchor B family protein [Phycisphaerales bacterium]